MYDILIVLNKNESSSMTPVSDKGKKVLPNKIEFSSKGETEFLIPSNWMHFEAQGLLVKVEDNR